MSERAIARAVALCLSAIISGVVTALLLGVSGVGGHLIGSPFHRVGQGSIRITAPPHSSTRPTVTFPGPRPIVPASSAPTTPGNGTTPVVQPTGPTAPTPPLVLGPPAPTTGSQGPVTQPALRLAPFLVSRPGNGKGGPPTTKPSGGHGHPKTHGKPGAPENRPEHGNSEHGNSEHGTHEHGNSEHGTHEHGNPEHGNPEHGNDE